MVSDEDLARKVRDALPDDAPIGERKMFGGLSFLFNGHMACGIVGDALMLRLGTRWRAAGPGRASRAGYGLYRPSHEGNGVRRSPRTGRGRASTNGSTKRLRSRAFCHQSPPIRRGQSAACRAGLDSEASLTDAGSTLAEKSVVLIANPSTALADSVDDVPLEASRRRSALRTGQGQAGSES